MPNIFTPIAEQRLGIRLKHAGISNMTKGEIISFVINLVLVLVLFYTLALALYGLQA
jgi:hypothetical protein